MQKVLDNTSLGPGITNGEEEEMKLTHVVPFLVEDELLRLGAIFEKKADRSLFPSRMAADLRRLG